MFKLALEKTILVALERAGEEPEITGASLEELTLLAETAGAEVLEMVVQRRAAPDPACYIGKGKAQELAALVSKRGAGLVIFNDELSPSQLRNLDQIIGTRIVDRTALIPIFARRPAREENCK